MKKYLKNFILMLLAGLLITAAVGCGKSGGTGSEAQKVKYPSKPVTLDVPYAAGGASELSARPFADQMQKLIGQPMVIVNKPGAGGGIGAAEVARAKPDGYTLLNGSTTNVTIVTYTSDLGYTYKDLKAVAQMTEIPAALAVSKNSQFKTLEEFIKYAKEHPGQVRVGTPGAGTSQHIALESLGKDLGIKFQHMPYEGANPAVAALLGGHIEATITGVTEITGHYKSGELRVLGVATEKRVDILPEVPTFKEQGYNLLSSAWYGVLAPKDTPDEVVNKLAEALKQASENTEVRQAWEKLHVIPSYLGPKDFAARIEKDAQTNQAVLKSLELAK